MTTTAPIPFPHPKETLNEFGLRPKRSFGQNFLCDEHLVDRIAQLAPPKAVVVEIGAGIGGLTALLLNRGHHVIAIERDRDLLPVLRTRLAAGLQSGKLELCEADAKTVDYAALFAAHPRPHVLVGNLPYNLTGPLLQRATDCAPLLDRAVFLVQLEVAQRLAALPSHKTYGGLSVFAQNAFAVHKSFLVRRGAFYPQPQVDSAVIVLDPLGQPHIEEGPLLRGLVSSAFQKRRKTLRNAWQGVFGMAGAELAASAADAEIDLDRRGETLSVADFARMCKSIAARQANS